MSHLINRTVVDFCQIVGSIDGRRSLCFKFGIITNNKNRKDCLKNKYIVLVGPGGCGKTTHGKLLAEKLSGVHSDMSSILKNKFQEDKKFAEKYLKMISAGDLIPCHVINDIFADHSHAVKAEYHILTGFPRTIAQAVSFVQYMQDRYGHGSALDQVIFFEHHIKESTACQRAQKRRREAIRAGKEPRPDDSEEVVTHRYQLYYTETHYVLQYAEELGLEVVRLDATKPIQTVHDDIMHYVNQKFTDRRIRRRY